LGQDPAQGIIQKFLAGGVLEIDGGVLVSRAKRAKNFFYTPPLGGVFFSSKHPP